MKQYIDKAVIVAEIERRISAYQANFNKADNKIAKLSTDGRIQGLKSFLSFLNTLEVKEVDTKKIFDDEYSKFSNDVDAMDYGFPIDLADYKDFAKHFFELGLNMQKGE